MTWFYFQLSCLTLKRRSILNFLSDFDFSVFYLSLQFSSADCRRQNGQIYVDDLSPSHFCGTLDQLEIWPTWVNREKHTKICSIDYRHQIKQIKCVQQMSSNSHVLQNSNHPPTHSARFEWELHILREENARVRFIRHLIFYFRFLRSSMDKFSAVSTETCELNLRLVTRLTNEFMFIEKKYSSVECDKFSHLWFAPKRRQPHSRHLLLQQCLDFMATSFNIDSFQRVIRKFSEGSWCYTTFSVRESHHKLRISCPWWVFPQWSN